MEIEIENRGVIPRELEHLRVVVQLGKQTVFCGFAHVRAVGSRAYLELERPPLQSAIETVGALTPEGRALVEVVSYGTQLVGLVKTRPRTIRKAPSRPEAPIAVVPSVYKV